MSRMKGVILAGGKAPGSEPLTYVTTTSAPDLPEAADLLSD